MDDLSAYSYRIFTGAYNTHSLCHYNGDLRHFPRGPNAFKQSHLSKKKMLKGDGDYRSTKSILGFKFDGVEKTIWLEDEKRMTLLTILKSWLRTASWSRHGIKFNEFELIIAKVRHALLDASGRPNTRRDYEKALETIKLLTENIMREPLNISGTRAFLHWLPRAHNYS